MTILNKNNQSGRSMIEMLGVLAIIGVLSVGGISGYSKAMAKYKLTKAQDQITMLLMNIRTAYATSPSYKGLNSKSVAEYNLAPNEMVGSDKKTLYGTFGGKVFVSSTTGLADDTHGTENQENDETDGTYFYITVTGLGKEACRSLATSDWGADGLTKMAGTTSGDDAKSYNIANLPVTLSKINDDGLCDDETNSITWVYY